VWYFLLEQLSGSYFCFVVDTFCQLFAVFIQNTQLVYFCQHCLQFCCTGYWYWYWYLRESTCCQDKVIFCCKWHTLASV